jgi:hypothetical protein
MLWFCILGSRNDQLGPFVEFNSCPSARPPPLKKISVDREFRGEQHVFETAQEDGCVITELQLLLQAKIGKGCFSNLTKFAKKTIFASLVFGLVDRQWDGSFGHCEGHNGLGCAYNMKVCVLDSDSMLWEHNLFLNSWSFRSRSCDQPLLPCFHTPHFTDEFVFQNWETIAKISENPLSCLYS